MKRFLKWLAAFVVILALAGFLAFLHFVPPFLTAPPETFIEPERQAAPSLEGIADPAVGAIAERGKYIVTASGCIGCHQTPGPEGPIRTSTWRAE